MDSTIVSAHAEAGGTAEQDGRAGLEITPTLVLNVSDNDNHIQQIRERKRALMALRVLPEGLAGASAAVEALTARLASAHAGAVPLITAVVPPAADPVSLQSAAELSMRGGEHAAVAGQAVEELGRSGVGVGESGASYATGDAAAAPYLIAGG